MSTQQIADSSKLGVLTSPHTPLLSTLVAVVLGASFIEFNELLFPPKLASLHFWALFVVYYAAFSVWFGIATMSRTRPFKDTFLSRIWLLMGTLLLVVLLALMYFATRATESFLLYIWGWVIAFIFVELSYIFRYLDNRLPEPIKLGAIFLVISTVTAIAYSIWVLSFPPIPDMANWVFVFVAFATFVSYRLSIRLTHAWQLTPSDQQ
jgi:hypothetical protein